MRSRVSWTRLDSLESEVASVAREQYAETPVQHFGSGFGPALERLRSMYFDWTAVVGLLDNLDDGVGTPEDMAAEDHTLGQIEARSRRRHLRPGKS